MNDLPADIQKALHGLVADAAFRQALNDVSLEVIEVLTPFVEEHAEHLNEHAPGNYQDYATGLVLGWVLGAGEPIQDQAARVKKVQRLMLCCGFAAGMSAAIAAQTERSVKDIRA